jgi:hypothetical protein
MICWSSFLLDKNATPQELLTTINEVASKGFMIMKIIQDDVLKTKN